MRRLDRYFLYDHGARQRTIFISVVTGAAAGIFLQFVGAPMKLAATVCVIATAAVQLGGAIFYTPATGRVKRHANPEFSARRSLLRVAFSAASFLVLTLLRIPRIEAAAIERKLQRAVKEGPPYQEVKRLLVVGLRNGIEVHGTTLDMTRRTITEAYLALPEKEQEATGVTLAQIAAYDVYLRTGIALQVLPQAVFLSNPAGYNTTAPIQGWDINLIGVGERRTGLNAEFDYTPETPAVVIYHERGRGRDAIAGYFYARRPMALNPANAPAFVRLADRGKLAIVNVIVSNLSQALDNVIWVNVTFDHCHISYHGGETLLKDVVFQGCEFESGSVLDGIVRYGDRPVTLQIR